MKGARHIGWVSGIPVRVHWSFFLVIVWSGYIGYRAGGWGSVLFSITLTLILFACVFLHELGHALAARRYGVGTRSITLLPIGGVAALERIPERPFQELVIALAGPAVNVVIAALLYAGWGWPDEVLAYGPIWDFGHLVEMILVMNLVMIGFNMIPAFPMDGGRVLRACLAWVISYERATAAASVIGQGFAAAMIYLGVQSNPFLVLIGVMVFLGARAETRMVRWRAALAGLTVREAMERPPPVLDPDVPLRECLERWHEEGVADFLVERDDRLLGVVDGATWRDHLRDPDHGITVGQVMVRPVVLLRPDMPLVVLCDLVRSGSQAVFPVVEDGRAVGLVTRSAVFEWMRQGGAPAGVVAADVSPRRPDRSWLDVG